MTHNIYSFEINLYYASFIIKIMKLKLRKLFLPIFFVATIILFVLALYLTGNLQEHLKRMVAGDPTLTITYPKHEQTIQGSEIKVHLKITNFILTPSGINDKGEGHVNYFLDGKYVAVASDTYTFRDVSPGKHRITATLNNNDNSPLAQQVSATIVVNVVS